MLQHFFSRRRMLAAAIAGAAAAALPGFVARADQQTATADYVAHEWGTFTSIQGSDGVPLRWNPFVTSDLPGFVFNRTLPTHNTEVLCPLAGHFVMLGNKSTGLWLQRMETPVIYFHSEKELTVDVHVRFPKGQLTEWFPQVTSWGPVFGVPDVVPNSDVSHLRWNGLRILSQATSAETALARSLPVTEGRSHYYPARRATANLVESTRTFVKEAGPQRDRMLFYRGAGDFTAPLRVSLEDGLHLKIANQSLEPVGPLFALKVENGRLAFSPFGVLSPGATAEIPLPTTRSETPELRQRDGLASALREALTRAGLYDSEATAMVETWRDSWLAENGVRVLYLLDRTWTDRSLPLELNPAPRELVRVMVGRADVFMPTTEWQVSDLLAAHLAVGSPNAATEFGRLGLGRFLEPAITRASALLRQGMVEAGQPNFSCSAVPVNAASATVHTLSDEEWNRRVQELKLELGKIDTSTPNLSSVAR